MSDNRMSLLAIKLAGELMRYLTTLAMMLALASGSAARAQAAGGLPPDAQRLSDQFFQTVKQGRAAEGFRAAFKDVAPILGAAQIENTAVQAQSTLNNFGAVIDWTPMRTTKITDTLVEGIYVVRYAQLPVFFRINFYNPGTGWRIVDVRFGTLEEAEKLGYFRSPTDRVAPSE